MAYINQTAGFVEDQYAFHTKSTMKFHRGGEIAGDWYARQSKEDIYKSNSIYLAHKLNQLVSEHLEIIAWVSVGLAV